MTFLFSLKKKKNPSLGIAADAFNSSTQEAQASGSLCTKGQPGLVVEYQGSQSYKMSSCPKKTQKTLKKISLSVTEEIDSF